MALGYYLRQKAHGTRILTDKPVPFVRKHRLSHFLSALCVALSSGTSLAVYRYDVTGAILGDFGSLNTMRPKVVANYLATCAGVSFGSANPCVSEGIILITSTFDVSTCQPPNMTFSDIQTMFNQVANNCTAQGHEILLPDRLDGAQKYFDVLSNSLCWAQLCEDDIVQSLESSWIATCANVQLPFPLPVANMFVSTSTLQRASMLTCMLDYIMDTPATTFGLVNPPLESPLNCYPPGADSLETDCPAIGRASFDECIRKFEGNNTDLTNDPMGMPMSFNYSIQDHQADIIFDFCGLLDELTTSSARECLLEICAHPFSPPSSAAPYFSAPVLPTSQAPTGQLTDATSAPTTTKPTSTPKTVPTTPAPVTKAPTTKAPTTKAPVALVTPVPVTKAPTVAPTKAPVVPPTTSVPVTKAPTVVPTKAPVVPPTKAPTRNPVVSLTPVRTRPPTSVAPTKAPTKAVPSSVPSLFPSFNLVQAIAGARCLSSFNLDNVTAPIDTSLFNSFVGQIESSIYNVIADLNGKSLVTVIQLNRVAMKSALEVHFEVNATQDCFVSRRQCENLAMGICSEYNDAVMTSVRSGAIGASLRANSAVFGVTGLSDTVAVKDSFTIDNTYSYVTDVPVNVESERETVNTSSSTPAAVFHATLIGVLVSLSLFLA